MTSMLRIIALAALVMSACAQSRVPEDGVMGNTNWLASCESSDDCDDGTQCVCGVCTLECASSNECAGLAGSVCDSSSDALASACGAAMAQGGLCLPQCSDSAPCGDGQRCVDEHCLPEARVLDPSDGGGSCAAVPSCADSETSFASEALCQEQSDACREATLCGASIWCAELDPVDREDAGANTVCEDPDDCVPGALKVALLWIPHGLESGDPRFEPSGLCPEGSNLAYGGQVAQPIDVEVSLPLEVDISMLEPPPAHALAEEPDNASGWTVGHLVLYRDGNGNGLLDPRDLEHSSPDEVLGTSGGWGLELGLTPGMTSHVIYYSEEPLPGYEPNIEAGYNVFRDVANANASGGERTPMPLDTPIPVPVSEAAAVPIMNCEELCFARDSELDCPATVAELPLDGSFECYGSSSLWSRTRCEDCFCFTAVCSYDEPCPG